MHNLCSRFFLIIGRTSPVGGAVWNRTTPPKDNGFTVRFRHQPDVPTPETTKAALGFPRAASNALRLLPPYVVSSGFTNKGLAIIDPEAYHSVASLPRSCWLCLRVDMACFMLFRGVWLIARRPSRRKATGCYVGMSCSVPSLFVR